MHAAHNFGSEAVSVPPTITANEIATLFRVKPATFLRKRSRLEHHGFPRPLPLGAGAPIWSRALVLAWIDAGGAVPDDMPPADPVAAARAALEARIGGAA